MSLSNLNKFSKIVLQILRDAATKQEERRKDLVRGLQESCASGDLAAVKSVLCPMDAAAVASTVNYVAGGGNTLLFKAAEHGHKDVVNFLLEHGGLKDEITN